MTWKVLRHTADAGDCVRLDALVARLCAIPRARARGLIAQAEVLLNGVKASEAATIIHLGDTLQLRYESERKYKEPRVEQATRGYTQVFLDDDLVVVDKQSGILTVPTPKGEANTLISMISRHLAKGQKRFRSVAVVHRLDRETSGLLVFGRSLPVAQQLSAQFAARKPEREYLTVVAGTLEQDHGTVRSHLATDKALNQKSVEASRGELAVTHYQVTRRGPNWTRLAVRLETGRRNQIRVHMAELGHPVLGDERYGDSVISAKIGWKPGRLALHARVLGFIHPITKRPMRFESLPPDEFGPFS